MHVIRSDEQKRSPSGTVTFEGRPYGSGVSFFLVNLGDGQGAAQHRHPYSETWIVRAGKAEMNVDGKISEALPGDIVVVGPHTWHGFRAVGPDRLDMICIHASDRIIQEDYADLVRSGAKPK